MNERQSGGVPGGHASGQAHQGNAQPEIDAQHDAQSGIVLKARVALDHDDRSGSDDRENSGAQNQTDQVLALAQPDGHEHEGHAMPGRVAWLRASLSRARLRSSKECARQPGGQSQQGRADDHHPGVVVLKGQEPKELGPGRPLQAVAPSAAAQAGQGSARRRPQPVPRR
jgi:hypothetical protein